MEMVLLTALGVGGATVFGALLGFCFQKISHRFSDIVLSFAAGVMLAAAVIGLVLPSLEFGGRFGFGVTVVGIFCGALCLNLFDRLIPHLHKLSGVEPENHPDGTEKLAVTNIGVRPTVGNSEEVTVEPWILDYSGDLYGQKIRVDFFHRLRGEKKFSGLEELKEEIHRNAEETRKLLG